MPADPSAKTRDGRQRGKGFEVGKLLLEGVHHVLDQRVAKTHATQPHLGIADGIENGGGGLLQIGRSRRFVQQRDDVAGNLIHQRHLHEDERDTGHAWVEEAVAAAVAVQPVLHVGPAADVVHGLVLDELFDQRRGRIPADAAQLQKADVEPGGEHVLHLHVQREQALVALEVGLHLGAHLHQEDHPTGVDAEALQQASAGRHRGAAVMHLGGGLVGRAQRGGVTCLCLGRLLRVGHEHLAHQQPQIAPALGRGAQVKLGHGFGATPAFDFAHARIDDGAQLLQRAAQHARRHGLVALAQGGGQPLAGGTGGRFATTGGRAGWWAGR